MMFRRIDECTIDELYCALDDLGFDMNWLLKQKLSLVQVRNIYRGLLTWQLRNMHFKQVGLPKQPSKNYLLHRMVKAVVR
jgi:hypothetical protein